MLEVRALETEPHHRDERRGIAARRNARPEPVAHGERHRRGARAARSALRRVACAGPRRARSAAVPRETRRGVSGNARIAHAINSAAWSSWWRNVCSARARPDGARRPRILSARSVTRSSARPPGRFDPTHPRFRFPLPRRRRRRRRELGVEARRRRRSPTPSARPYSPPARSNGSSTSAATLQRTSIASSSISRPARSLQLRIAEGNAHPNRPAPCKRSGAANLLLRRLSIDHLRLEDGTRLLALVPGGGSRARAQGPMSGSRCSLGIERSTRNAAVELELLAEAFAADSTQSASP